MRRLRSREEGASLVEVSLVLPVLIAMAIGLAEVGFLVIDYITVTNSARSGARTGAAAADDPLADENILNVVEEDLCNLRFGDVVNIQIFEANADGSMPDPVSSNLVNTYIPNGALQCNASGHAFICDPMLSCNWDPTTDRDRVPPGLDDLGVQIGFTHTSVTGLFPFPDSNWDEAVVMQIEPDTSVSS